jgi:Concanavalin A-like lectin/glucanases superfamily/PEP-CTERM motif
MPTAKFLCLAGCLLFMMAGPVLANPYEDAVLSNNPLVYYRFEENTGATTAMDSSFNGNDGTYSSTALLGNASAFPNLGTAPSFDGGASNPDQSVAVPALGTHAQISVEAWVNPASLGGFNSIYNTDSFPGGALHFQLQSAGGGQLEFTINNPSDDDRFFPGIPLNAWTYILATYDSAANNLHVYFNGAEVASSPAPPYGGTLVSPALANAHIGAWNGNSRQFNGLIDEFAIYDHVLSADDAMAHYLAASAVPAVPEPAAATLSLMALAALGVRRRRAA